LTIKALRGVDVPRPMVSEPSFEERFDGELSLALLRGNRHDELVDESGARQNTRGITETPAAA
jgi:hypothetical protein